MALPSVLVTMVHLKMGETVLFGVMTDSTRKGTVKRVPAPMSDGPPLPLSPGLTAWQTAQPRSVNSFAPRAASPRVISLAQSTLANAAGSSVMPVLVAPWIGVA